MRASWRLARLVAVLIFASAVVAAEPSQVFPIRSGERIVHLVGAPFTDPQYAPLLEAWLLRDFAGQGLVYRRVSGSIGQALPELERRILIHHPTTVVIQTGNWELLRERHYDFSKYAQQVTELLGKLVTRQVRVILCSPVPVGVDDPKGELQFIPAGLARWVDASRESAQRAGVLYIDLYTAAVDWPMVGPNKLHSHYDAARHQQSFDLFRRQIHFVAEDSAGTAPVSDSNSFKDLGALKTELDRGQTLTAALADIAAFAAPPWLRTEKLEQQRAAARRQAEADLAQHDARVREILSVAWAKAAPGAKAKLSQHRAIFQLPPRGADEASPRVVKLPIDFRALLKSVGESAAFDQSTIQVVAVDGARPGEMLPFRFDPRWHEETRTYGEKGTLAVTVVDTALAQMAVPFGAGAGTPTPREIPIIGDGDLLRLAGDGRAPFSAPASYPWRVDFDGDGRRDLIGSDRYGTGAQAVWFRNVGTDETPVFSARETYPLETVDGKTISNPNRGWMLTPVLRDWDGDGLPDLLVGGWCRYLTFYKNIGTRERVVFAVGRSIFDANIFPGFDYGKTSDSLYQGVFIEPCDWDGDGREDLLCGSYARGRIFFLRATGRDATGLPILAPPVALQAGGQEIDFLMHGKPSVGDWDGDGDLDLISGQYYGEASPAKLTGAYGCYYFENTGSRTQPVLAKGTHLRDADGRLIWNGFHTGVTMLDWNRDGRMDIFASGMRGSTLYLRQGEPGKSSLVPTPVTTLGSAPGRVSNFASPLLHDIDRDGVRDLLVGDGDGYVYFFRGGADQQYLAPVKMKSEGREIHEIGCPDGGESECGYVKFALADWNRDGHPDLIMWSNNGRTGWQNGFLGPDGWCLKFFPGTANPLDFGAPSEIQADGRHIMAGYRSKPEVADLDGDGWLDLVVSCGQGTVRDTTSTLMFFRNLSGERANVSRAKTSATSPPLAAGVPLVTEDGKSIGATVRTAVRLADWDGDGDLDLFAGNHSPGLRYWENRGSKTKPVFAAPKTFTLVNETTKSSHEIGVDVVAFDGGRLPDLVIGNGDNGQVHLFRRSFLEAKAAPTLLRVERQP